MNPDRDDEVVHRLDVNSDFHWQSADIKIVGPHVQGTGQRQIVLAQIGQLTPKTKEQKDQAKGSAPVSGDFYQLDDTRQKLVQVGVGVRCPAFVNKKNWDVDTFNKKQSIMKFEIYNQGKSDSEGNIVVVRVDNMGKKGTGWDLKLSITCTQKPKTAKPRQKDGSLDKDGTARRSTTLGKFGGPN